MAIIGAASKVTVFRLQESVGPETFTLEEGASLIVHAIVIDVHGGTGTVTMQTAEDTPTTLATWLVPVVSRNVATIQIPFLADKGLEFVLQHQLGGAGHSTDVVVFHGHPGR
jgi:hypothetical protein